ncbi:hypothetical protein JTB14_013647 [Gonioctena quinquepunctata]|nr:hypothetical protein JTB14_013647 [Gonioctena quinquepunctata]
MKTRQGGIQRRKFVTAQGVEIEQIKYHGYPLETHEVQTEDGYILTLYRIPHGKNNVFNGRNNNAVLVQHGLFGNAEKFVFLGPSKSLGYFLADNGYDVWLNNARGSNHSRRHRTMDPDKDNEFWKFTWHEIGVYDIPASIDYILNVTNSSALSFIGHSQGCTSFFVMGSERADYHKKVKVMIALAPAVFFTNITWMYRTLSAFIEPAQMMADILNIQEVPGKFFSGFEKEACTSAIGKMKMCRMVMSTFISGNFLDLDMLPSLLSSPGIAGVSFKEILHFGQLIRRVRKFMQFNWGNEENMRRYGSAEPQQYDLRNISTPVAIFFGEGDIIVSKQDVDILANTLPNVIEIYKVPERRFGHLDFFFGNNIDVMLNDEVLNVLKRYDSGFFSDKC